MPEEMKPVLARQMEVYAAFMEHTDHHVGRLIDAIDQLGVLDDTLVYVIVGDNGASAEGTLNGAFNEMANFNAMAALETPEFMVSVLDKFGSPDSYNHYSVGWAHACNTPYQWTKQVASHWGGTRNGTIVRWPTGITASGETRDQFCHVIDVAPTILEVAGLPHPTMVNGVMQAPIEGTSMAYSFDAPQEPERHDLQYFEMFGNRGVYHKGWSAVTKHRTPWIMGAAQIPAFDDDVWELYDGTQDWTQSKDLSKEMPDRLHELQRLWLIEATKYNVLPLDDRTAERLNADIAGRPQLVRGNSQVLFGGMGRLSESSVLSIKNKSFSVTAEVVVPEAVDGTIIAQGGRFGGWSLYAKEGRAAFVYNVLGIQQFATEAETAIPDGTHQVRMEFAYDGGGLGKGGAVTLYYDGEQVGEGRVEATQPFIFSADETTDVGYDAGTPVSADTPTGQLHRDDQLGPARRRDRHPRPPRRPRPPHERRDVAAIVRDRSNTRARMPPTPAAVTLTVRVCLTCILSGRDDGRLAGGEPGTPGACSWLSAASGRLERSGLPRVVGREQLASVLAPRRDRLADELRLEEQVGQQLGVRRRGAAEQAREQRDVGRAHACQRTCEVPRVDVGDDAAQPPGVARAGEQVGHGAVRLRALGSEPLCEQVDLAQIAQVLDERIHQGRQYELEHAVREIRARAPALGRLELGAGEGGVRGDHDDAVDAEIEGRLDWRVESRAAVEEPVRIGLTSHPHGAEEDRYRRRRKHMLVAQRPRHIVHERRVRNGRLLTRLDEDDRTLGAGARRHDRQRVDAARLQVRPHRLPVQPLADSAP